MLLSDAISYYSPSPDSTKGARSRLANVLGITVGAISQWGEVIPEGQAYKLQSLTNGELQVRPELYRKEAS